MNTKNILLIGRTGSGKSSLANLLLNREENFEKGGNFKEVFKESDSSVSETREIKSEVVEIKGVDYRIIDTIGIGDTKLPEEEIAYKIFRACYEFDEGLTQVLFVIGGRITLEEIKVYNVIRKRIFNKDDKDEDIAKFTTIVRTKFSGFRDAEKCEEDVGKLKKENNNKITRLIKLINSSDKRFKKIIHVDNPSLNSNDYDEEEIVFHKKRRKYSRSILVEHLENCLEVYRPNSLKLINEIFVEEYVDGDRDRFMQYLKEEIEDLKKESFISKKFERLQLLKRKIETAREMLKSSLRATIEMKNNCKQM